MKDVEFVFYSGGFDTTSYLLECLLLKKIKVQPLIVKSPYIDGEGMTRISNYHEEIARNNFYYKFKNTYPSLSNNLLNEIVFTDVILDSDTIQIGKDAFNKKVFSREVNQLLYFHQICKDNNLDAVVGYQKDDIESENDIIFFKKNLNFRTPLLNYTKHDLLNKAIKNKYDSFLYETWSCWNPLPNNKPCGKCELCKITIVETRLKFPIKTKII